MYNFVFGILLVSHGLAHIFDFIAIQSPGGERAKAESRTSPSRPRLVLLLWLAAAWTLTGSGLGIFFDQDWWPMAAIFGAMLSLAAIIPWWNRVRRSSKLGVMLDIIILVVLLTPLRERVMGILG